MVRHRLNIARMIYRLEFGHMVESDNVNPNTGEAVKEFKEDYHAWAGKWSLNQSALLSLAGNGIKDTVTFVVRHNDNLTSDYTLRLDKYLYHIDLIKYDEGRTPDAYDLITCHRLVNKHG